MSKLPFSVYDTFAYLAAGLIVAVGVDHAFALGYLSGDVGIAEGLFAAVALYVVGHLVAHTSSTLLESVLVCRWLGRPEERLMEERKDWPMKWGFRVYAKPLPEETRRRLTELATGAGFHPAGQGFFYHCHGVAQRDAVSRERLASFLNLYGFCRNASLASALCCGVLVASAVLDRFGVVTVETTERLWFAAAAAATSLGLFVRYLKFYRHYTSEVYLAFLASRDDVRA